MATTAPRTARDPADTSRQRHLRPRTRKGVLTVHVLASVGLLGVAAAQLVLAWQAALAPSGAVAAPLYRAMRTVVHASTIPLAVLTLGTSLLLGLRTRWGLFRYWWVVIKSVLFVAAVVTAIAVLRPALVSAGATGTVSEVPAQVLTGQLVAFSTATALSVFKPWGPVRRGRRSGRKRE
jgi:hypothetical protein